MLRWELFYSPVFVLPPLVFPKDEVFLLHLFHCSLSYTTEQPPTFRQACGGGISEYRT